MPNDRACRAFVVGGAQHFIVPYSDLMLMTCFARGLLVCYAVVASFATAQPEPAGFTIPQIDLAGQTHRQVVVDREKGQYLGHPTTVLMADGRTVLCVYPKGHGKGPVLLKRSDDGGVTWSGRLETPVSWATSKETPTLYRVRDTLGEQGGGALGGERLIMFSGLCPVRMASSDDSGETWSELEPIGAFGGIVANASLAQRDDGTLVGWFHDDGRFIEPGGREAAAGAGWSEGFVVYQIESVDAGRTWTKPRAIVHRPEVHLCEPGLVISPDGKTWALLLRENSRSRNSFVVFSEDDGASWSEPRELPAALTGDRHSAVYAPDGRLFISFRDTARETPTQGDWVGWVGEWDDIANGREGAYRVRLEDNHHRWDCAYPGVVALPDGTILATTYGHWTQGESPWILSVRFTLDELDGMVADRAQAPATD